MGLYESIRFCSNMQIISFIARSIAVQHLNHERRNERINYLFHVVKHLHESRYQYVVWLDNQSVVYWALREVIQSSDSDQETHSAVRGRLFFVTELCAQAIADQGKIDQEAERQREIERAAAERRRIAEEYEDEAVEAMILEEERERRTAYDRIDEDMDSSNEFELAVEGRADDPVIISSGWQDEADSSGNGVSDDPIPAEDSEDLFTDEDGNIYPNEDSPEMLIPHQLDRDFGQGD